MKHFFNKQRMAIVALLSLLTLTGQSCGGPAAGERVGNPKQLTLNYWTVFNNSDAYAGVIAAYRAINPHVIINVKTLRPDEYENALLEAFAEDREWGLAAPVDAQSKRWGQANRVRVKSDAHDAAPTQRRQRYAGASYYD